MSGDVFLIIEIDGYFHQALIYTSQDYSMMRISEMYIEIKRKIELLNELPRAFCTTYNMTEIESTNETKADIVIDIDTDRIYKPQY
ncbi:hypothetical protein [Paenibacillus sp. YIM B09110]|uniref:hypothetical protein n=1 Tax=Paenibacillus sp. YIM B09110 TaxID=3126102 RepID=UPI00301DA609